MDKYFQAPLSLVTGSFDNIKKVVNNISMFAICHKCINLGLPLNEKNVKESASYCFNMTLDEKYAIEQFHLIENSLSGKEPIVNLNVKLFWDFYKNTKYKNEFDIACLLAMLAINSLIGKNKYCFTNKQMILARMFGYASTKEIPQSFKHELFIKYSNRYHIDKVLEHLQTEWHLKLISDHVRGFYLSFNPSISLQYLATICHERKHKTKLSILKLSKKHAIENAKK